MLPPLHTVRVRDANLSYVDVGTCERVLLVVHGYCGGIRDFAPQLDALAQLGRTVVFDQRGHGRSSHTGRARDYTLERLTDDLEAFVDALALGPLDLMGHSMGGMIAQRFALRRPGSVRSLLLMNTSPRAVALEQPSGLRGELSSWLRMLGLGRHIDALKRRLGREVGGIPEHVDPVAFEALRREICRAPDLSAKLSAVSCPTLALTGEHDALLAEGMRDLSTAIVGARFEVLAGAAHSPQLETPEAWLACVRSHLQAVR